MKSIGSLKKRIAGLMISLMLLSCLSGCGKKDEEPYSSPSFSSGKKQESTEEEASQTDASLTDALAKASYTDAEHSSASLTDAVPATLTDASPMGMYQDNVYYNALAEFKITVDDENWKFFSADDVAKATGKSTDFINNLWYGYTSPQDYDTTYAAIASNVETGSTIIVSYINPAKYDMPEFTAREYLEMAANRYDDLHVRTVTFLAQKYECLDISAEKTNVGRRTEFAIDRDGLIILITFTMSPGMELEEAVELMTPLYY